jgi:DNA-directed RNA polymerase specialized sigma24 family protein
LQADSALPLLYGIATNVLRNQRRSLKRGREAFARLPLPRVEESVGVAYDEASGELRDELIFDPQTSGLLAEQTTVVHTAEDMPFPPGSVVSWTCYLASGVVDSSTATTSAMP